MDILSGIQYRTSYRRKYEAAPVPREDLMAIMEAGLAAPSGCSRQTTSLIGVDSPELLSSIKKQISPPIFETAPALICVLTKKTLAYRDKSFYVQDYAAAIENMLLAIVALGYESCWYEGHITDKDNIGRRVADILNVPLDHDLVCILPVGKAKDSISKAKKKPFAERGWFNGFQSRQ